MRSLNGPVRLILDRGTSKCLEKTLAADSPRLRLDVGSSALSDWRVHARGVRARHAHFVWTGKALRVEPQTMPGAVKVDGRPVAHRFEITASATLELGQAIIRVEWPRVHAPDEEGWASSPTRSLHEDETRAWPNAEREGAVAAPVEPEESDEPTMIAAIIAPAASRPLPEPEEKAPSTRVSRSRMRRWVVAAAFGAVLAAGVPLVWGLSTTKRAPSLAPGKAAPAPAPAVSTPSSVTIEPLMDDVAADAGAPVAPAEAAEHLVQGRLGRALALYRQLAERHPEQAIYKEVVRILERDVGQRCAAAGGGSACAGL